MNTQLFHCVDGAQVITRTKGIFHQRPVYRRGARLYAGTGGGFIRLGQGDATSNPNTAWEGLDIPDYLLPNIVFDKLLGPVWQNNK
jgi:hypothetical protein